jgi:hydrogenase nickel incorporation protein HypA/HybF
MHELGIVFHVIKSVKAVAEENNLTEISKVTLSLGEVSTVIPEYMTDCWAWAAAKEELLKDAELAIEMIPAVTYCEDCQQTYGTVEHGKICPYCKSEHTYLKQGNEAFIKEIEAC